MTQHPETSSLSADLGTERLKSRCRGTIVVEAEIVTVRLFIEQQRNMCRLKYLLGTKRAYMVNDDYSQSVEIMPRKRS